MVSLEEFLSSGILLTEKNTRIERTKLVEAVLEFWNDSEAHTAVIISPRQQGKTTIAALVLAYQLLVVPSSYSLVVSGSQQQAEALIGAKLRKPLEVFRRQYLQERGIKLEFSDSRIVNTRTRAIVEIIPTTSTSSVGRHCDLVLADEARTIPSEVLEVIRPSAIGGRILIIGTPGPPRGWFFEEATRPAPRTKVYHFKSADLNPTLDPVEVEAEKSRLRSRGNVGERLLEREWAAEFVEIEGTGLFDPTDVRRCGVDEVAPFNSEDVATVVSGDLSTHRDITSLLCIAKDKAGRMRIVDLYLWDPATMGPVDLVLVSKRLELMVRRFDPRCVILDRYQATHLVQDLRSRGVANVQEVAVTGALNAEIFTGLMEVIRAGRVSWRRSDRLENELLGLRLSESVSGNLQVRDSSRAYHRDVAFSLALGIWKLEQVRPTHYEPHFDIRVKEPELVWLDEKFREPESIRNMREIAKLEHEYSEIVGRLSLSRR